MKKSVLFLLVVISLFACVSTVFAKDASELIGTITSYVEEIQKYPEELRDACGTDMFNQKLFELANLITMANDAMMEAGLPNTLNLWAVYSAVTSHSSDCSFFESALSKADWSREELDRIGYKYGLFNTVQKTKGCICTAYDKNGETCIEWSPKDCGKPICKCIIPVIDCKTTKDTCKPTGDCLEWSTDCGDKKPK